MAKKPKPSLKLEKLNRALKSGKVICRTNSSSDEPEYSFEPGGASVGAWAVNRALELGLIVPAQDALFPDMDSQTYRAA
ncbi:hypothetical protein ACTJJ7_20105 [Phyllobacterium sp. 22229]|uniref:hypothetical protein n=1 Tax=Phyllobacterium sp. 22229 TaxID=3453895 RepID=UPI003F8410EB